jgi:DNA-binding protein Fis
LNLPFGISLQEVERALILKTLEDTGGNRSRAAEILGINRRTLQNKLKEYEIN